MMWFVVVVVILVAIVAVASLSKGDAVPSNSIVQTINRGSPQGFLQRSHSRIVEAQDIVDKANRDIEAGVLNQQRLAVDRDRLAELYAQQFHEPQLDESALQDPAVRYWFAQIDDQPLVEAKPELFSVEWLHTRYWMFFLHAHLWIQELHTKSSSSMQISADDDLVGTLSTELAGLEAYANAVRSKNPLFPGSTARHSI